MKEKGYKYRPYGSYQPEIRKFDIENRLLRNTKKVLDIDKVLEGKNYTKDELLIAKLILAEQAYLSGFVKIGDRLVKQVERFEDKGKDVIFYLQSLQLNKTLYIQKSKHQNKYVLVKIKEVNHD